MLDVVIPVHNGRAVVGQTLAGLLALDKMDEGDRQIIVVDDGSTDNTAQVVEGFADARIHLVRLQQRSGRATACNTGVAASAAEAVLLLDADCLPLQLDLLHRHEQALADGYDLSFGAITAVGDGFWSRYARVVAAERAGKAVLGDFSALTSCNMAIRRSLFEQCGGFHAGFRHYGFEDRDLIASLLALGARTHFDPETAVLHATETSVAVLCRKMEEAGRCTAAIFQGRHPEIYQEMRFSRVDVRTAGPAVRAMSPVLSAAGVPLRWLVDLLTQVSWLPVPLRISLVRLATGLAFLRGTRAAAARER